MVSFNILSRIQKTRNALNVTPMLWNYSYGREITDNKLHDKGIEHDINSLPLVTLEETSSS